MTIEEHYTPIQINNQRIAKELKTLKNAVRKCKYQRLLVEAQSKG